MNYSDWVKELDAEERAHGKYREKASKVEKRYQLKEKSNFNILWSNVEIQQAALYSQTPKPDVQRRHKEQNQLARQAAEIMERALVFSIDQYDFDGVINPAINNHLVAGLGQVKIIYDAFTEPLPEERIPVETLAGEDGDEYYLDGEKVEAGVDEMGAHIMRSPGEAISRQDVWTRVVPWSRFLWSASKDYEGVWWQGEILYMTEDQVRMTYDIPKGVTIPLKHAVEADQAVKDTEGKLAKVYEIWNKRDRKRCGLIVGIDQVLYYKAGEEKAPDDPYQLQGFWPYPKPLFSNASAGDWCPIPDYLYYQEQALELERVSQRINALTKELKWRGVSDGTFKDLSAIAAAPDGKFVSIDNFAERFGDKGGLDAVFAEMPLNGLVATLKFLYETRDQIKQTIFEITGLSDIIRGATDPNETLGAQQMKGQFANLRTNKRQKQIQRFIRDILRIKAEIIAEHFEPEQLSMMTGIQVTPEIQQLLKSDVLRNFSIDIETDSTILADQTQEQQNRVEVVQAITQLVTSWAPLAAQAPQMLEIIKETTLFLLGGFKAGSALETTFSKLSDGTAPGVDSMAGLPIGAGAAPANNVSAIRGR